MYVCISTSLVYANDEVSQHVAIIAFYAGQYAHGGETGHAAIEKAHSRRTSFKIRVFVLATFCNHKRSI